MTLIDKIREAVFRAPPAIKPTGPTEVIGGIEVFKMGAAELQAALDAQGGPVSPTPPSNPPPTPHHAYGQNRRHRGR